MQGLVGFTRDPQGTFSHRGMTSSTFFATGEEAAARRSVFGETIVK
ncbi:MAG: hypothetical protein WA633_18740 [Stellaceae bacterium]